MAKPVSGNKVSAEFATVGEAERLAMQWNSKGPMGMGLEEEKNR